MEYYDHAGNASATLSWSSPSTMKAIIPQSQLYPVTNPPPAVVMTSPGNGATYTAAASVTMSADADSQYNNLTRVDFYAGGSIMGTVTNFPYTLTTTGLGTGSYTLTAAARRGAGVPHAPSPR